jgi:hypothetical protein
VELVWGRCGSGVESVRQWRGVSAVVACIVVSVRVRQWSVVEASVEWRQCGSRVELLRLHWRGSGVVRQQSVVSAAVEWS